MKKVEGSVAEIIIYVRDRERGALQGDPGAGFVRIPGVYLGSNARKDLAKRIEDYVEGLVKDMTR